MGGEPRSISISVGVVVACEETASQWIDALWRPVGIVVGAPEIAPWTELKRGPGFVHYFAGTFALELHRRETEAYLVNLANEEPVVYVVAREVEDEASAHPIEVHLVTVNAFEAQDYLDSGEEIVEPIPMPEPLIAWVRRFVDKHHVEETFVKRKRDKVKLETLQFGKEPIFARGNGVGGDGQRRIGSGGGSGARRAGGSDDGGQGGDEP